MFDKNSWIVLALLIAGVAGALAGCNKAPDPGGSPPPTQSTGGGHSHDGWWCPEHGMPEEVCAQCNSKVAADFKAKGDWCADHDRPDSQCFVCHPEKEAEFAAQYEAKYGKKPPQPHEGGHEHGDHDHAHEKS